MKTIILKPTNKNIAIAADVIRRGGLVGMPTETVYGLAASALDEAAVVSIFTAKNRPNDNPLIVHVHKDYDLTKLVDYISSDAKKLLATFTPGPLTLVFKSNNKVAPSVSKGLGTVAIRIPDHKVAHDLLAVLNLPLAAPSANVSTRMSATTAADVKSELDGKLPYILDGGACEIGIESTVVDVSKNTVAILRPGKITKEMLQVVLQKEVEDKSQLKKNEKALSPGMKYKHYSPSVPVFVCNHHDYAKAKEVYHKLQIVQKNPVIICLSHEKNQFCKLNTHVIGNDEIEFAKNIYTALRKLEKKHTNIIICAVNSENFGSALLNRLKKMHSE